MGAFFSHVIYQPLYNAIIFLYNVVPGHDFGIAIVLITIALKLLLMPISKKQIESQQKMTELQPKIKELQQKYKNEKEKQTREIMDLYKKNKTNPLSGCLPLIVQLVFLIAIYRIIMNISAAGLTVNPADLYSFVPDPGKINKMFLGIVDLSAPSVVFAVLAAAAQFYQTKLMMKSKKEDKNKEKNENKELDFASVMSKQMLYLGPFLTLMIGIKFSAGLSLYWLVSTLFMVGQQLYIEKNKQA